MVCSALLFSFCIVSAAARSVGSDEASLLQHHLSSKQSQDDDFGKYISSDGHSYSCNDKIMAWKEPRDGVRPSLENCKNFCRKKHCNWLTFMEDGSGCKVTESCDDMVRYDSPNSRFSSVILFRDGLKTPVLGDATHCSVSPDSVSFDGMSVPKYQWFWLVKAHDVSIQGFFAGGRLNEVAIAGQMFDEESDERKLIIGPGYIYYRFSKKSKSGVIITREDEPLILETLKSGNLAQYADDYLYIRQFKGQAPELKGHPTHIPTVSASGEPRLVVDFLKGHYTSSVHLDVLRSQWEVEAHISLMTRTNVTGMCGNMDGSKLGKPEDVVEDADLLVY